MQMTLLEVRSRQQNLLALSRMKLPYKLAYGISKNLMKLEQEVKLIEERRISMLDIYAKKDDEGKLIIEGAAYDLGENEETFRKEFTEFLETETEVDIHMVPYDSMEKLDESRFDTLTPAELISLDFMIKQPEEPLAELEQLS